MRPRLLCNGLLFQTTHATALNKNKHCVYAMHIGRFSDITPTRYLFTPSSGWVSLGLFVLTVSRQF